MGSTRGEIHLWAIAQTISPCKNGYMVAITSSHVYAGQSPATAAVPVTVAPPAPRPVVVRRFSPSSIAAVVFSFVAFTGLVAASAATVAAVITWGMNFVANL